MTLPDPNDFLKMNNSGINPEDYTAENVSDLGGPNPLDYVINPQPDNIQWGAPPLNTPEAVKGSINDLRNFSPMHSINPYQLGKTQPFGAGLKHHQFERYYNHPKFEELGFSPFRNNEVFYNENSSAWDDFRRAWGEWGTLTRLGFTDAMGFGDLTDYENARTYERAMAIGQSSREGAVGFGINLYLNSGYTFGIMGELAAEELGLALLTAASGGLSSEVTVPAMAARGTRAFNKIRRAWEIGKNLTKTLGNLRDVNKARMYFKNAAQATGRFLNPLEQTTQFLRSTDKLQGLSNMAKTATGFGAFYRDIRNLRLVYGESSLEGGMVQNQMEDELLAEHYRKYGRPPTDEEAKVIRDTALQAGMSTAAWNMPVIFMSNKIVFDNMFKGFNPMRKLTQDVIETGAGRIIKTASKEMPYQVMKKGFSGFIKGMKNPKTWARTGLNYFKANFAEGLQETSQEIISGAAMDYYKSNMGSPTRGGVYAAIGDNIEKQMTKEGAEIFLSGFLMGGLVQPVQSAGVQGVKYAKMGFSRLRGKGTESYREMKEAREQFLNHTVNMLNDMYQDPAKYFAPDLENLVAQSEYEKGMKQAAEHGDAKSYYDLKDASVFQHIMTALKTGHMEGFIERLEGMKDLSRDELKDAFPGVEDQESFVNGIDKAVSRARNLEKRYHKMQKDFPNPYNPAQYRFNSDEYKEEMKRKIAYNNAIANVMFLQNSFDRTLERITSLQGEVVQDAQLENVAATDFNAMFSIKASQEKIDELKKEIAPLLEFESLDKEGRRNLKRKQRKLALLEEFSERLDEYLSLGGGMTQNERFIRAIEEGEMTAAEKKREMGRRKKEEKARKKLYASYRKYLRGLAEVANNHAFDINLDDSFQKLLDIYQLEYDATHLVDHINALTDPSGFQKHYDSLKESYDVAHENRKAQIEDALRRYLSEMKEPNELLIALHDAGMFFNPSEMNALLTEGKLPEEFYYAEGANKLEPVEKNSEAYKQALDIVSKYVEFVMDKPVPEKRSGYESKVRERINGDNRTYEEYAEQFGFDPKSEETTLSLKDVLIAIVDSPYSTEPERALARRLSTIAQPGETVTFRRNMAIAGDYSPNGQTVIDPRYASSDFEVQGTPLETTILRQEIKRHMTTNLKGNSQFKNDLEALFNTVKEAEALEDSPVTISVEGLLNFAIEAMTNPEYQNQLGQVQYDQSAGKTTWTGFVDAVVSMLRNMFGYENSNNALNGAIDLITMKIGVSEQATEQTEVTTVSEGDAISRKTPVSQIANLDELFGSPPKTLIQALVDAYKEYNESMEKSGSLPLDKNWKNMTDQQIINSVRFEIYIGSHYSTPKKIIEQFNKETGRKAPEQVQTQPTQKKEEVPLILNTPLKEGLKELGYSDEEIKEFNTNPAGAKRIVDQGITKEERRRQKEVQMKQVAIAENKRAAKMKKDITDLVNNAENIQELEQARTQITVLTSDLATFDKTGLTRDDIKDMISQKEQDLAFNIKFDDVQVGEAVIMNDDFSTKMIVDKKTPTKLHLSKVGDPTFTRTVFSNQVNEKIKYRYSEAMEKVKTTPEKTTDTEKKLSNEDLKTAQNMNSQESIQADVNAAKESNRDDLLDDMLDDIEKCE